MLWAEIETNKAVNSKVNNKANRVSKANKVAWVEAELAAAECNAFQRKMLLAKRQSNKLTVTVTICKFQALI